MLVGLNLSALSASVLASTQRLFELLSSLAILPMAVVLLFIVLCCDKVASHWSNWRPIKSGQPYALELEDEHYGGHHGEIHMTLDAEAGQIHYKRPANKNHRKSAGWSIHADPVDRSTENTAYSSSHYRDSTHGYEGIQSPPLDCLSPPPMTPGRVPGGYMTIAH